MEAALQSVRDRLGATEARLTEAAKEREALDAGIQEKSAAVESLEGRLQELLARAAAADEKNEVLERERARLEADLRTRGDELDALRREQVAEQTKQHEAFDRLGEELQKETAKLKAAQDGAAKLKAELDAPMMQQLKRILGGRKKA